ncbi:hypothetical protein AB0E27_28365 [Streptomyces sparsogenes]|uniref:hypothetical protein n=1 Tax=Streptomyces sparsogenes TaxID=67365 RepID=UPI0033EC0908
MAVVTAWFDQSGQGQLIEGRVSRPSYGTVSALRNLAYDGGMGVGAAGFGLLAAHTGYAWGFALTGVLMMGALVPLRSPRAAAGP